KPVSSFSRVTVAVVSIACAVMPAVPSWFERAMVKHPACAAASSSSGLVPGCDSNLVANEYGVSFRIPLGEVSEPLPSLRPPDQCALAFLCMIDDLLIRMRREIVNGGWVGGNPDRPFVISCVQACRRAAVPLRCGSLREPW